MGQCLNSVTEGAATTAEWRVAVAGEKFKRKL